jgi:hypothetical protein
MQNPLRCAAKPQISGPPMGFEAERDLSQDPERMMRELLRQ